jgi:hypothetical protein
MSSAQSISSASAVFVSSLEPSLAVPIGERHAGYKAGFCMPVSASQISAPGSAAETGSMTGWWVASLCPSASTIQSSQTARFRYDSE